MWAETVAALGYGLVPHGWEKEVLLGVDLVVHRNLGIAIVVTAGEDVGDEHRLPQVRYERKEVTLALVNGSLDTLWGPQPRPEWEPWFLLHKLEGERLDAELSRPRAIGDGGMVTQWVERVLLPGMDFTGAVKRTAPDTPPEVNVTVERRVG
jgi:hypothetical protein